MLSKSIVALALAPVALAHFTLKYPASRGFDEDKETTFPCGGFDTVSSQRTDFPISGAPIQINLGHQQTNIGVYMAIGDNPGDGFSIKLHEQFQVSGYGDFCMGSVSIPSSLNVTEGTKASIQVITNAHGEGGLYQVSHAPSNQARDKANANAVQRRQPGHSSTIAVGLQHQLQERHRRLGQPRRHLRRPQCHKRLYKWECLG